MIAFLLAAIALAEPSSLEEEMRTAHDESRYITARRLAEELLAEDPDNLQGLYVMGRIQWLSEGNHARAMHYLSQADRLYIERYDDVEDQP